MGLKTIACAVVTAMLAVPSTATRAAPKSLREKIEPKWDGVKEWSSHKGNFSDAPDFGEYGKVAAAAGVFNKPKRAGDVAGAYKNAPGKEKPGTGGVSKGDFNGTKPEFEADDFPCGGDSDVDEDDIPEDKEKGGEYKEGKKPDFGRKGGRGNLTIPDEFKDKFYGKGGLGNFTVPDEFKGKGGRNCTDFGGRRRGGRKGDGKGKGRSGEKWEHDGKGKKADGLGGKEPELNGTKPERGSAEDSKVGAVKADASKRWGAEVKGTGYDKPKGPA